MRIVFVLPLLVLVCVLPARAQSTGTANIALTGQVQPGTCTIGAVSMTMPTLGANAFNQSATWTGGIAESYTPLDITLTACAGVTGATFVFGAASDADTTNAEYFKNKATGAAPHTAIRLRDTRTCSSGNSVKPGDSLSRAVTGTSLSLPLCAIYYKLPGGIVTRGGLSTHFTVTVTYR